jgi:AcrR family transcriptional regulator
MAKSRKAKATPRKAVPARPKYSQPVTERGQRSREMLLKAAEEVFGEQGYHDASIVEIVRRAGVAHGTFYTHFESKHAIFGEILRSLNHLIRSRSQAAAATAENFIEAEERGFRAFFDLVRERPNVHRLISEAEFVDPKLWREHYTKICNNWAKRISTSLNAKGKQELDVEAISYCLFGIAALATIRWPYWTGGPIPPKVLRSVLLFIENGMGPYLNDSAKGRKKSAR